MANNRVCLACGKAYEYCNSCPSSLNLPVWKNLFDTENCKTVFETASDYAQGAITKESARVKLSKCDINVSFKGNIKKILKEINKEDVKENIVIKNTELEKTYGNKKKLTRD